MPQRKLLEFQQESPLNCPNGQRHAVGGALLHLLKPRLAVLVDGAQTFKEADFLQRKWDIEEALRVA